MTTILSSKTFVGRSGESTRGFLTPRTVITATALSLAIGGAVNTYAQEGRGVALEEIVVTATRREEGLQTIPASISAVTAADLENRGIVDFSKVTEAISGVSLSRPGSAISSGVYVRGVGTAGTSPANQSVGVLVDGVYQLRVGAAFTELMDIDRVEILRGPQGTLFGRNTTAGVIRIFTADPDTEEFSGKIQGVVGNLDAREVRGLVNVPIIEGKLAARFSGYTAERDGYTQNVFTDTDTRNVDREGYRAKLLWDVTDNFQAKLSYEDSNQESNMDLGRVAYSAQLLSLAPQLANYPVSLGKSQENAGLVSDDVQRTTVNFKWSFADHVLSTTSAWDEIELFLLDDRDRTPLTSELNGTVLAGGPGRPYFYALTNAATTDSETHEIQLNSEWEGPINYVLGYYIQTEELISDTTLFASTGPLLRPPTMNDVDSEAYFGTVFYEINDQWKVSGGVRYTDDQKQGMNSVVSAPWNPNIVNKLGEVSFDEWTYSFKLTNQINADLMAYAAYDKGFKSGGINREFSSCGRGGRCITPDEATWDPEISYNYELGMKSEWLDNTLRINGALYFQTYEDFQVTQDIQTLSNVVVMNATEVESMGVEADFLYLMSENLTVNGSVALGTTEYKDYDNATCTPGTPGCVGGFQDLSGKQLDHAPKLSFNVGGEYRDALANLNDAEWFTRLDVVYKSDQNLFFEQPHIAEQDAYYLVNARMGIEGFDGWKFTLWADNLLDEEYLAEAQENLLGDFQIPGIERTYGVTVDYAF